MLPGSFVLERLSAERGVDAVAGEGDGEGSGLSGRRFALRVLMVISPSVKGDLGFGLAFGRGGEEAEGEVLLTTYTRVGVETVCTPSLLLIEDCERVVWPWVERWDGYPAPSRGRIDTYKSSARDFSQPNRFRYRFSLFQLEHAEQRSLEGLDFLGLSRSHRNKTYIARSASSGLVRDLGIEQTYIDDTVAWFERKCW